ncbi:sigma factor G inhibitor Gin [Radiobacillus sp. PE A8.2]|uniref:sigma factor G inhibitor Gin n=1 Tax=Radiobacillus sp. PE A8.2 TaxID=3380349 RepID=UPI00388DF69B
MKVIEHNETCGICDQEKAEGYHLYNLFICCECEQKMIHTEPQDSQYNYYLEKLRNLNQPTLNS